MQMPAVPASANLNEIHTYLKDLSLWLENLHLTGLQSTEFGQSQLDQMVSDNDLKQGGKFFTNKDTGKINKSEVLAGVLTITEVA